MAVAGQEQGYGIGFHLPEFCRTTAIKSNTSITCKGVEVANNIQGGNYSGTACTCPTMVQPVQMLPTFPPECDLE